MTNLMANTKCAREREMPCGVLDCKGAGTSVNWGGSRYVSRNVILVILEYVIESVAVIGDCR